MNAQELEQLYFLLERYRDGSINSQELQELELFLRNFPEAKVRYLEFARLHTHLRRALAQSPPLSSVSETETRLNPPQQAGKSFSARLFPAGAPWSSGAGMGLGLALGLMLLAGLSYLWWTQGGSQQNQLTNVSGTSSNNSVARIAQRIDCDMELDKWKGRLSDYLVPNQTLVVDRGLLVIEFHCGATVTLEGPAEFEVLNDWSGFLYRGKLTAKLADDHSVVDDRPGFRVFTELAEVVDLGTEFGINVDDNGAIETHVFSGEVHLYSSQKTPGPAETEKPAGLIAKLVESQASRIISRAAEPIPLAAAPQAFVRLPFADAASPNIAGEDLPWSAENPPSVWLDAEHHCQTDDQLRIVSWKGIELGEIKSSVFWQLSPENRPFLINQEKNRRAIRFMGNEFLVSEPQNHGDSMTVFLVGRMLPQKLLRGQSAGLIDFGGQRNLRIFRDLDDQITAQMSACWENGVRNPGSILKAQADVDELFLLSFRYEPATKSAELYLDGKLIAEDIARDASNVSSNVFLGSLGRRLPGFVGELNEVMIFESALDVKSVDAVNRWLIKKYQLPTLVEVGIGQPGDN